LNPSSAAGLAAALLFARGRPEGLALLPNDLATARASFRAALICLPLFLIMRVLSWWLRGGPEAGIPVALVVELIGYSLSWTSFAVVSLFLAGQAKRAEQWPQFIAAWNWANVVQYVLLMGLAIPAALGLPGWMANALGLAALGYAVWLEWFVVRVALNVAGGTAAMFVITDLMLGLFIGGISSRILAP
jgi:hypothetical protein